MYANRAAFLTALGNALSRNPVGIHIATEQQRNIGLNAAIAEYSRYRPRKGQRTELVIENGIIILPNDWLIASRENEGILNSIANGWDPNIPKRGYDNMRAGYSGINRNNLLFGYREGISGNYPIITANPVQSSRPQLSPPVIDQLFENGLLVTRCQLPTASVASGNCTVTYEAIHQVTDNLVTIPIADHDRILVIARAEIWKILVTDQVVNQENAAFASLIAIAEQEKSKIIQAIAPKSYYL
jgi:hypothetical protein